MNKKRNSGITLIALVISIIVLLIMSGMSVSMISGNNSILQRVEDAKEKTDVAQDEEELALDGYEDAINEAIEGLKKISDLKPGEGENVTKISETRTVTIKDDLGNKVKVPKGFGIAKDSGINVEDGIVIEDADSRRQTYGSQFVWVPIGDINVSDSIDSSGKINITLARGQFHYQTAEFTSVQTQPGPKYIETTSSNNAGYYYEFANDIESRNIKNKTYENTKAKDLPRFVESAIRNGGYYIARYEAGINANTDQYTYANCSGKGDTLTYGNSTKIFAKDGSVKPLSIEGKGVWNAVTQSEAATISRNTYNTKKDKITSDLINSYACDTAVVFIQKCGNNGDDSKNYPNQNGFSAISTSSPQLTGKNKLKYEFGSGQSERMTAIFDMQCKICDLAGNVRDWTTETSWLGGYPAASCGGWYSTTGYGPASRGYYTQITAADKFYGFRVILYF